MRVGVVVFPGSNCDLDVVHVVQDVLGWSTRILWHAETSLVGLDLVVLPGGFSYGDYLRPGALASYSPIMAAIKNFASKGGLVLGICNGFQILLEAGMLEGALMQNRQIRFVCKPTCVRVDSTKSFLTASARKGQVLSLPIAHHSGSYYATKEALKGLNDSGRILFRYVSSDGTQDDAFNPNGSIEAIAGVSNEEGNVVGLMPHPERAAERLLGSEDGLVLFRGVLSWISQAS
jgi:phosphoribosylformylglycinamidine synthase